MSCKSAVSVAYRLLIPMVIQATQGIILRQTLAPVGLECKIMVVGLILQRRDTLNCRRVRARNCACLGNWLHLASVFRSVDLDEQASETESRMTILAIAIHICVSITTADGIDLIAGLCDRISKKQLNKCVPLVVNSSPKQDKKENKNSCTYWRQCIHTRS